MLPHALIPLLSWSLAEAPSTSQPPHEFADDLASVEMLGTSDEFQLVAYDTSGDPIGTVAFWSEADEFHIASDFADGYDEIVVGEDTHRDSTLPSGVAADRAQAMLDVLGKSDPQEGKVSCALALAANVAACANPILLGAVLLCGAATYHTGCACAEFVGDKPPEDWC